MSSKRLYDTNIIVIPFIFPLLPTISRSNNTSLRIDKGFNQFGNSFNRASTKIPLYNKVLSGNNDRVTTIDFDFSLFASIEFTDLFLFLIIEK